MTTFHSTDWLVWESLHFYNPHIIGLYHPLYQTTNQSFLHQNHLRLVGGFWGSQHLGRASYSPQHSNLHQASNRGWLVAPQFWTKTFSTRKVLTPKNLSDEGWMHMMMHFLSIICYGMNPPILWTCGEKVIKRYSKESYNIRPRELQTGI